MSLNTAVKGITHGQVHNAPQSALELFFRALFEDIHFLMDQCQTQSPTLETDLPKPEAPFVRCCPNPFPQEKIRRRLVFGFLLQKEWIVLDKSGKIE